MRRWHRDRNYFDANDAILILSRYLLVGQFEFEDFAER